jgi:chaperonin GroEL (HSP60 family)
MRRIKNRWGGRIEGKTKGIEENKIRKKMTKNIRIFCGRRCIKSKCYSHGFNTYEITFV